MSLKDQEVLPPIIHHSFTEGTTNNIENHSEEKWSSYQDEKEKIKYGKDHYEFDYDDNGNTTMKRVPDHIIYYHNNIEDNTLEDNNDTCLQLQKKLRRLSYP